ncbi:MAG: flagellin, partial [Nitrospinales bacterium]
GAGGGGKPAESLGLGGGRNIVTNLVLLRSAMEKSDVPALRALLANLDSGLESLGGARARFGAIAKRLEESDFSHDKAFVDKNEQLSDIEDIDFAQKASELASLEQAFQATLNASARILRPSILDFLA